MRILVSITGASGIIYGKRMVEALRKSKKDAKLVISSCGKEVAKYEKVDLPKADYSDDDIAAPPASGTNGPDVMIVIPCSMKTLGKIANGIGDTLATRAAEVALKERKKLILVIRETPLSLIAIENMRRVTLAGGIILPACPGFYHNPKKIDDLVDYIIAKTLNVAGIKHNLGIRWKGE
jgi:4-hydroxy-3-polyprenylbenzoate decarboxylase